MEERQKEIIRFVEPVFRFCLRRVNNRQDAEDLASEIILHVLDGMGKYEIRSLEAWVRRIAYNRYAVFCKNRKNQPESCSEELVMNLADDFDAFNEESMDNEYETVFYYLHTLSSKYKNILVDYYIGELSVKELAEKYDLPETTIKWRLNIGRQRIRDRIKANSKGDNGMDKVYKRINWNTRTCNGSMNPDSYISNQVSRAICEAAYEKPLTIEEISLKTGLPTMYIEDALPRLIYGDAIEEINGKYATCFIVLRLKDKEQMEKQFEPLIDKIADYFESLFAECAIKTERMSFYGHDWGMKRLGHIALPLALREKVRRIKDGIESLADGPYPPRKDGGYGWFIVEEAEDESDIGGKYASGCNIASGEGGCIYYYHIRKYFLNNIYNNGGTRWLAAKNIPQKCKDGVIPKDVLSEDDIIRLLQVNLIKKADDGYRLHFPCFTQEQFAEFSNLFRITDTNLDKMLTELIISIKESFLSFVPKRLYSQINQWISCFVHCIIGYVTDELIARNALEKPDDEKPFTSGVFFVEGKYINV